MIFVSMVIEAQPQGRDPLTAAMQAMMTTTRHETGCIAYTYSADLSDPNRFHLVEIWESEEVMDAHIDADHSYAFIAALNQHGRITSVKAFDGEAHKFRIRAPNPR
jgi:quinol monooxygenase YgiN